MIKSKRIDSFFKKKACDEDEKNAVHHLKFRNLMRIQILKNWLHLKTSIDTVHFLSLQACAFKGHDKSTESHWKSVNEHSE